VKALTMMLGNHSYNLDFVTEKFWLCVSRASTLWGLMLILLVIAVRKFLPSLEETTYHWRTLNVF